MSGRRFTRDFFFEVAKGNVPKHKAIFVTGNNTDIDTGVEEDVWEQGGVLTYLTSAETMNIVSTAMADDGDPAGIGARTVLVTGLSSAHVLQSETVTMNGVADVLTSLSYLRVRSLTVVTAGSTEANAGVITATASSAATVQCAIAANEGISNNSHYTVPAATKAYIIDVYFTTTKEGGGAPIVHFLGFSNKRIANGAWVQVLDEHIDTGVFNTLHLEQKIMPELTAKTDIRVAATTTVNNTEVTTRMYIVEVAD